MDFYLTILTAIIAAGLPADLMDAWDDMRPADKKLVANGGEGVAAASYRLRATASFRDIAAANVAQQSHKDRLATFFTRYDAIVMPISMVTAFPHQQQPGFNERILDVDGKPTPYPAILNWISPATVLHTPALAVQAGQTAKGMPVGVQIVGPWHREDRLFDFAFAVEEGLGGFRKPAI
jgi:amidase